MAILAQQIHIFPHPDFTRCGLRLCGSCNLFHSVQYSVLHNSISVRHIKNIQITGECRINLSNQVYTCNSMVQNSRGNSLKKRDCRYLCNIPCYGNYGQYYQKWNQ